MNSRYALNRHWLALAYNLSLQLLHHTIPHSAHDLYLHNPSQLTERPTLSDFAGFDVGMSRKHHVTVRLDDCPGPPDPTHLGTPSTVPSGSRTFSSELSAHPTLLTSHKSFTIWLRHPSSCLRRTPGNS